jgi:hypothetical protein
LYSRDFQSPGIFTLEGKGDSTEKEKYICKAESAKNWLRQDCLRDAIEDVLRYVS